jgi:NAD(P)-dependent dehydrogenase (short-subunit alcohol dehydrogenase family)
MGRGIALKLAEKGVKVAINYRQNEAAASDTISRVRDRGSDGLVIQADVSHPEDIRRMFSEVQAAFGRLDIFVSNGLGRSLPTIGLPWTLRQNSGTRRLIQRTWAAVALGYFAYNFIKIHRTRLVMPAVAAGVTDRVWEVSDLVALLETDERRSERAA